MTQDERHQRFLAIKQHALAKYQAHLEALRVSRRHIPPGTADPILFGKRRRGSGRGETWWPPDEAA